MATRYFQDIAETILSEIARSTQSHRDHCWISMIRAMEHYKGEAFWFNENATGVQVREGKHFYQPIGEADADTQEPVVSPNGISPGIQQVIEATLYEIQPADWDAASYTYKPDSRKLIQKNIDYMRAVLGAARSPSARKAKPMYYSWDYRWIFVSPVPDKDYYLELDIVLDPGIPYYRSISGSWRFFTENGSNFNPGTYENIWTNHASELIRNRAKWDLYMSLYDDEEKAQKCAALEMEAYRSLRHESAGRNRNIEQRPSRL